MNVKQAIIGLAVLCFVTIFCSVMTYCGKHGFAPGVMESIPKKVAAPTPHPPGIPPTPTMTSAP